MRLLAISFDWTISLGVVIQAVVYVITAAAVYSAAMRKFDEHTITIRNLTSDMTKHADQMDRYEEKSTERMDRYDEIVLKLVGDLQRIVGRMEAATERRHEPR